MNARAGIPIAGTNLKRSKLLFTGADPVDKRNIDSSRVVVLSPLTRNVPDFLANPLAQALQRETGQSLLKVDLVPAGASVSLDQWGQVQTSLNGDFHFARYVRVDEGCHHLTLQVTGSQGEMALLKPLLNHFRQHFQYVIFWAAPGISVSSLVELLALSDAAYFFVSRAADSLYDLDSLMQEIRSDSRIDCSRCKPILCLARGERAPELRESIRKAIGPAHAFFHNCPGVAESNGHSCGDNVFAADVRRLAREIGRCRLGLALSSGSARGLAHIGVIQVLEENGIEVDVVAGCSMGAYVGAVWGCGCDGSLMEKLAREVEGHWGLWKLIDPILPPRQGFIRGQAIKRRLQRTVGESHFSDLARPVRVVATNLYTLERMIFSSGEVASAVHASSAIPGVCAPVIIGNETYVDGGISDPLPVDVLEEMGVERIIAVNTIASPAYMRSCLEMEREQAEIRGRRFHFFKALNQRINYFAPGNILDIMMRAVHGAQIRVAEEACRHADVVLRPLAVDGHWYEFDRPAKYIALGRRAAEQHLDEIRSLVKRKIPSDELESIENKMAVVA